MGRSIHAGGRAATSAKLKAPQPMLEAIDWQDSFKTGDTWPQLFRCQSDNDSESWVLKLPGRAPATELAADWIGCTLALHLGIPTPLVEIANVSADALHTAPAEVRGWARPGPAFASRYIPQVFDGLDDSAMSEYGPSNAELLGGLYALDTWIEVLDRRRPDGIWNLLYDVEQGRLLAHDFGKSLTSCFGGIIGGHPSRHLPEYPPPAWSLASRSHALVVCAMMAAMKPGELGAFVASSGPWLDTQTREKILHFLLEGLEFTEAACRRLGTRT